MNGWGDKDRITCDDAIDLVLRQMVLTKMRYTFLAAWGFGDSGSYMQPHGTKYL